MVNAALQEPQIYGIRYTAYSVPVTYWLQWQLMLNHTVASLFFKSLPITSLSVLVIC